MAVKQLATCTNWYDDPGFTSSGYSEYYKYDENESYVNAVIDKDTGKQL